MPSRVREAQRFAEVLGVNVHAQVAIPARDRARLERLCRYVCRPPLAQDRLEQHASGKLRYTLKKPWKDGTVALLLEPLDLTARVCALVPPPRQHLVGYHGVLSSHAKLRSEVVPAPDASTAPDRVVQLELFGDDADHDDAQPRRTPWAWLLRHVFEVDVTTCPRCSGPMRWIEAATAPDAIAKLLAKHGLGPPTSADEVRSAGAAAPRVPEELSEPCPVPREARRRSSIRCSRSWRSPARRTGRRTP